ncbi:MAG: M20/M25/M40 family metallo-hydrolase [Planctomycetota bacterium]
MRLASPSLAPLLAALAAGVAAAQPQPVKAPPGKVGDRADEPYLQKVRQLTFGDERAGEAYFSPDGTKLLFQAKGPGQPYYQIYVIDRDGKNRRLVSTGKGKTTCAFFQPGQPDRFIYASSHLDPRTHEAPAHPPSTRRYRWDYDDAFDVFLAELSTGKVLAQLTTDKGYDAECSFSPDGKTICFTARRGKHADAIYLMDADGKHPRPLVQLAGVDCGGPFFSPDGEWVIYRVSAKGSRTMQVYMTTRDGKTTRRLTRTPRINWAPFFHPSGRYVVYAATAKGSYSDFDLFLTETSGSFREVCLTRDEAFDGLPAFSPDGKQLVWSSGRAGEPQVFVADFVMPPESAFQPQPTEPPPPPKGHGGGHDPHGQGQSPHQANPHQANPHADPHQSNPHQANPHADPHAPSAHGSADPHAHGGQPGAVVPHAEALAPAALAQAMPGVDRIQADGMLRDLGWLADDARRGRRAGSPDELAAARYLAGRLAELGVRPGGSDGAWLEPFSYARGGRLAASGNALTIDFEGPFALGKDYQPLLYSKSGDVNAQLAFCGYAMRDEEHGYDDLAGLELKGKVAVVLTGGPRSQQGGAFGRTSPSVHEDLRLKVAACRDAGAVAVLLVRSQGDGWLSLSAGDPGVLVAQISPGIAQHLGLDVRALVAGIDRHGAPQSRVLSRSVGLSVRLERPRVRSQNVVGRITGRERPEEVIVVGAHYDHLGLGGEGSLSPEARAIHNGADDNASGCAALLAVAEALRAAPPRRTVLLVAFGAEEEGLIGSKAFVEHPPLRLERVVAMLNMDMLGRRDGRQLLVGGAGTSPAWTPLLQRAADLFGQPLSTQQDGFGPSDHASFYGEGVPVLFLWTGNHADYHKPTDDVERIDRPGLEYAARVAYALLRQVDGLAERPAFRKVPRAQAPRRVVTGERGAYFGSIPNYAQEGTDGVLLDGARAGTPAAKAGIEKGDVIVKFNGMTVKTIHDYVNALRLAKPGQTVKVEVRRGEKVVELEATLGGR